jgi:hypothetical protein
VTISGRDAIRGLTLQEVVGQIPDAVVIVQAPPGSLLLANDHARALAARRHGRHGELEVGNDELKLFCPDGRDFEKDDWPILRSARHGAT